MKVLRVRYLLHWLDEAEALRMLKGVEGAPQEIALSALSSGTLGSVGLRRGDHESAHQNRYHVYFGSETSNHIA